MQDPKDLPEIPDIQLPDPASPARKRTGLLLGGMLAFLLLCCAAVATVGVLGGGIGWLEATRDRATGIPTAESNGVKAAETDSPSVTATPAPRVPDQPQAETPIATTVAVIDPSATIDLAAPTATLEASAPTAPTAPIAEATAAPAVNVAREITDQQLRVFSEVWQQVNDQYVYPNFNGVNWASVREEADARIQQGMTNEAFYAYIDSLIVKLGDDHSSYLSPQAAREEDQEYNGTYEYAGVGLITEPNASQGYIYVLQVLEGGPAEKAGIRPHDHILLINDQPVIDANGKERSDQFRGTPGTDVLALVRTPGGEPRTVTLTRARINAKERVDYRVIDTGVKRLGYVLIPTLFEEDIDERLREALKALAADGPLDGLILDLRVNGGGALEVLRPALGFFTRGDVGRLVNRRGSRLTIGIRAENISNSQKMPLAVLIGPATESYAEVFAGALKSKGRATLIGQNTAGNIETLRVHEFEDGSRLWLAEEGFKLPNGDSWEGAGLAPDVPVAATWDQHDADNDPVITAAVQELSK